MLLSSRHSTTRRPHLGLLNPSPVLRGCVCWHDNEASQWIHDATQHTCSSTGKRPAGTDVLKGLLSHDTSRYSLLGEAATLHRHSQASHAGLVRDGVTCLPYDTSSAQSTCVHATNCFGQLTKQPNQPQSAGHHTQQHGTHSVYMRGGPSGTGCCSRPCSSSRTSSRSSSAVP